MGAPVCGGIVFFGEVFLDLYTYNYKSSLYRRISQIRPLWHVVVFHPAWRCGWRLHVDNDPISDSVDTVRWGYFS